MSLVSREDNIEPLLRNDKQVSALDGGQDSSITPNRLLGQLSMQLGAQNFYGLPGTDGSFRSYYLESFRQEGSLGALMFSHPLHPLGQVHRVLLLMLELIYNLLFVTYAMMVEDSFVCQETTMQNFCKKQQFSISVFAAIFTTIVMKIFRSLLDCKCFLKESDSSFDMSKQRVLSKTALYIIGAMLFVPIISWVAAASSLKGSGWVLMFFISFLLKTVLFEPLMKIAFCLWSFKGARAKFEKKYNCIAPGAVSLSQVAEVVMNSTNSEIPPGFTDYFQVGKT